MTDPRPTIDPQKPSEEQVRYEGEKKETMATVKKAAEGKLKEAEDRLKKSGSEMSPELRQRLHAYFDSSLERADIDNDKRISSAEVSQFTKSMLDQVDKVIEEYAPTKEQSEAKQKEGEEALKAEGKAADAAKKGAEKNAGAVENDTGSPANLDEIPKGALSISIDQLPGEMEKYGNFNESFQRQIQASVKRLENVNTVVAKYHEDRKGILDAVSYTYNQIFNSKKEDTEIARINKRIEELKISLLEEKAKLDLKKKQLEEYGKHLGDVAGKEKTRLMAERDAKIKEMKNKGGTMDKDMDAKKNRYRELDEQQKKLEEAQKNLSKEAEAVRDKKTETEDKMKAAGSRKKTAESAAKSAGYEVEALQMVLKEPGLSAEGRKAVQEKLAEARKRQETATNTGKLLTEGMANGMKIQRTLTEAEIRVRDSAEKNDSMLKDQVAPALGSLGQTITYLSGIKEKYITSEPEVKEAYDRKISAVQKMDEQVDDFVLKSTLSNSRAMNVMSDAIKQLDKMKIAKPGVWDMIVHVGENVWGGIFGGIGEGFGWAGKEISRWGNWLCDKTQESNNWFVKYVAGTGAQVASFFTGAAGGAAELVGGIWQVIGHPWETVKGMGALIGRNPVTGEWSWGQSGEAWWGLVKAILSFEDWEKGHYGTAVGKIGVTVASFFIGAGEVSAAGKGASIGGKLAQAASRAGVAARLAEAEAIAMKGAEAGLMTGKAAATAAFIRALAVDVARGAWALPKNAWRAAAETATGAVEGSGAALKSAGAAVAEAPLTTVAKATGTVIAAPFKVTGRLLYGTARVSKDILLIPFQAPGRIMKTVSRVGKGEAAVAEAARASSAARTISENGAKYAEAEQAIQKITAGNEELAKMAQSGAPQQVEIARAKALRILNDSHPDLARAVLETQDAVKELQSVGKQFAEEALRINKKLMTNELPATELADVNPKVADLLKEQKSLMEQYTRMNTNQNLIDLERFYEGAKARLAEANMSSKYLIDAIEAYKKAAAAGNPEMISRARAALGNPAKMSDLDKILDDISGQVKSGSPVDAADWQKIYNAFTSHQNAVVEFYEQVGKAYREGGDLQKFLEKVNNPAYGDAVNAFVSRENFVQINRNINRRLGEIKVRCETYEVIKAEMSVTEIADALEAKFAKLELGTGDSSVLREVVQAGEKYSVRVNDFGKVELVKMGDAGALEVVKTSKVLAEEAAAAKAAPKAADQIAEPAAAQTAATDDAAKAAGATDTAVAGDALAAGSADAAVDAALAKPADSPVLQGVRDARKTLNKSNKEVMRIQKELDKADAWYRPSGYSVEGKKKIAALKMQVEEAKLLRGGARDAYQAAIREQAAKIDAVDKEISTLWEERKKVRGERDELIRNKGDKGAFEKTENQLAKFDRELQSKLWERLQTMWPRYGTMGLDAAASGVNIVRAVYAIKVHPFETILNLIRGKKLPINLGAGLADQIAATDTAIKAMNKVGELRQKAAAMKADAFKQLSAAGRDAELQVMKELNAAMDQAKNAGRSFAEKSRAVADQMQSQLSAFKDGLITPEFDALTTQQAILCSQVSATMLFMDESMQKSPDEISKMSVEERIRYMRESVEKMEMMPELAPPAGSREKPVSGRKSDPIS
jgi:hypothetical protein